MDIQEIKTKIFSYVEDESLLNLCFVDKFCHKLLSSNDFWKTIHQKRNLLFDDKLNYKLPVHWYSEFNLTKHAMNYTNFLFNAVKTRTLHTLADTQMHDINVINDCGIQFHFEQINDSSVFDVLNVNVDEISSLINVFVKDKLGILTLKSFNTNEHCIDYLERGSDPSLWINNINNNFYINIDYESFDNSCELKYNISSVDAKILIFRLISKGIFPGTCLDRYIKYQNTN
jgi:hypothetical protein